jgi:hypothetical protein
MAVGVFVWNLMRLPKAFPALTFALDYNATAGGAGVARAGERAAGS